MTNQEAIEILKAHMESSKTTADFCEKTGRADASYHKKNIDSYKLAIAALEKQEREKWHPVNPDDRATFPDDDRKVLVAFKDGSDIGMANFYEDDDGGAFYPSGSAYSYNAFGACVVAWKECPHFGQDAGKENSEYYYAELLVSDDLVFDESGAFTE